MSIVRSNGTLVKSDFTSNDTISYPTGMGSFFISWMKSFVLLMLCYDSLNGDSTFDRCFANWYVSVLMFDTMGLIGRSSILPLVGNLCNFAVPENFPEDEPVGYNFLYSYGESFDFNFLSDLCTFDSSVFVGSLSTCLNCFVVKKDTFLYIYVCPLQQLPYLCLALV